MQAAVRRTIADFAVGPFRPHGDIALWHDDGVIHIQATGPFNLESMQAMGRAAGALYADLDPAATLVHLVTIQRSLLAAPETIKGFSDFLAKMEAIGRVPFAVAWVVPPEIEGGRLMLPFFAKAYAHAGRDFRAFDNPTAAKAWLAERLAVARAQNQQASA